MAPWWPGMPDMPGMTPMVWVPDFMNPELSELKIDSAEPELAETEVPWGLEKIVNLIHVNLNHVF